MLKKNNYIPFLASIWLVATRKSSVGRQQEEGQLADLEPERKIDCLFG